MTTDRPAAGSPWARHCPDAYPFEWYTALGLSALPPGYSRFATDEEVGLITGRTTKAEPRGRTGRARPPSAPSNRRHEADRAAGRFPALNAFVDLTLRDLTRAEAAVWLVVFRDVKAETGTATVSQGSIAGRAGVSVRCVQKAVRSLVGKKLLAVVRRGRLGGGASIYRVNGVPKC